MKWEFAQAEFMFAWDRLGLDHIPAPLRVHPEVSSLQEWEAIEQHLRLSFPVLDDPDLLPVLRIVADPETSLAMVVFRKKPLRGYGAITADIGVSVVQRPGPESDRDGNVVIEVGSPARVAHVCAAVAGNQPPGKRAAMVETWDRVQDGGPVRGLIGDDSTASAGFCPPHESATATSKYTSTAKNRRPSPPRYIYRGSMSNATAGTPTPAATATSTSTRATSTGSAA